jgi:hypothetical protein
MSNVLLEFHNFTLCSSLNILKSLNSGSKSARGGTRLYHNVVCKSAACKARFCKACAHSVPRTAQQRLLPEGPFFMSKVLKNPSLKKHFFVNCFDGRKVTTSLVLPNLESIQGQVILNFDIFTSAAYFPMHTQQKPGFK